MEPGGLVNGPGRLYSRPGSQLWAGRAAGAGRTTQHGNDTPKKGRSDTPVWWGICRLYNGGRFKHHAPFIQRRRDGLCLRTGDFLRSQGWAIDEELWALDGTDCSPCDDKVPDSH